MGRPTLGDAAMAPKTFLKIRSSLVTEDHGIGILEGPWAMEEQ